jgi:RimK family alpha-L-glutamate ligase
MKALFITNAFSSSKNVDYKVSRMTDVFATLGVTSTAVTNAQFLAHVADNGDIATSPLVTPDTFVVYFDKDRYIPRMLEKAGVAVFNSAYSSELCDDKMLTHIALSNAGIPMPRTLAGSVCYYSSAVLPYVYVDKIVTTLGFPLVAKLCHGSYGEQVYKINNKDQLVSWMDANKTKACLFQRYIEAGGRDIRVIVVGGKVVASMERQALAEGEFRSNIELGGRGSVIELPREVCDMAEKAAQILQLDFCGVDILPTDNGYYLCEVNSNAMFGGIESVTGADVAGSYCRHIVERMKQ